MVIPYTKLITLIRHNFMRRKRELCRTRTSRQESQTREPLLAGKTRTDIEEKDDKKEQEQRKGKVNLH